MKKSKIIARLILSGALLVVFQGALMAACDLIVSNIISVSPTTVYQQGSMTVTCTVQNIGASSAPQTSLGYYLSTDCTFDWQSDCMMWSVAVPALNPGQAYTVSGINVPVQSCPTGTMRLLCVANHNSIPYGSPVQESNLNNNSTCYGSVITVLQACPDLTITDAFVTPNPCAGSSPGFNVTIFNVGSQSALTSTAKVFLSMGSCPSQDWILASISCPSLGPNSSVTLNTSFILPTTFPGNYIVIKCDYPNNISECNENNNCYSLPITIMPGVTPSVSITASPSNTICTGELVTFAATSGGGGSSPSFQWFINGAPVSGATGPSYSTSSLQNNDHVHVSMTSSASCAAPNPVSSNTIVMSVSQGGTVSVSISVSANPICAGESVTFSATPNNGGFTPVYQWKVNGIPVGGNSSTYSYFPQNNDVVICTLTSSNPCSQGNPATSQTVTLVVNTVLPVAISISASSNPTCEGEEVIFTAVPTNGGSSPVFQWKVNGINVGSIQSTFSYIPSDGDIITCQLTSNNLCVTGNPATSNPVFMTVNPVLTVAISISPSANPVCDGEIVSFLAEPTNGGSSPVFQWFVNGIISGSNSNTFSYIPENGDMIFCTLLSNATCATGNPASSNPITISVNPLLPVSVSITPSANPVCEGEFATLTAEPGNGGPSPVYNWYVNGTNAGSSSSTLTYFPANEDIVHCILTSSFPCVTGNPAVSNLITMNVNPVLQVNITVTSSANPVCVGEDVTFLAEPVNGGANPFIQWAVNGNPVGDNSHTFEYAPVNSDTIYCTLISSEPCTQGNPASSDPIIMEVNPLPVAPVIYAIGNTLFSSYSDGNQWYLDGAPVPGANGQTFEATLAGWYWDVVTNLGCPSDTSNHVFIQLTGMQENQDLGIQVYPNPSAGRLLLYFKNPPYEDLTFRIYAPLGVEMPEFITVISAGTTSKAVDLSGYPDGLYVLKFYCSNRQITRRILLKK